jgi:hypothetical protein
MPRSQESRNRSSFEGAGGGKDHGSVQPDEADEVVHDHTDTGAEMAPGTSCIVLYIPVVYSSILVAVVYSILTGAGMAPGTGCISHGFTARSSGRATWITNRSEKCKTGQHPCNEWTPDQAAKHKVVLIAFDML